MSNDKPSDEPLTFSKESFDPPISMLPRTKPKNESPNGSDEKSSNHQPGDNKKQ